MAIKRNPKFKSNLKRSAKEFGSRVLQSTMPSLSETLISSRVAMQSYNSFMYGSRMPIRQRLKRYKNNIYNSSKEILENAKNELSSGNFFGDGDANINAFLDMTDEPSSSGAIGIDNSDYVKIMSTTHRSMSSSAEYTADIMITTNAESMVLQTKHHLEMMKGLKNLENIGMSLAEFNNKNITAAIEETYRYYNESLTELREIKESINKISSKYDSPGMMRSTKYDKISGGNRGINFSEYGKMVKENLSNLARFNIIKDSFEQVKKNPIETIFTMLANNIIPKKTSGKLGEIDKSFQGVFSSFLLKMNELKKSDKGYNRFFGNLFGLPDYTEGGKVNLAAYKNMDYETMERQRNKAVIEVIPTYLNEIVKSMTGKDMFYNFNTGKFQDKKAARKAIQDDMNNNILSGYSSTTDSLNNQLSAISGIVSSNKMKQIERDMNAFLIFLSQSGIAFDPTTHTYSILSAMGLKLEGGDANFKIILQAYKKLSPSERATLRNEQIYSNNQFKEYIYRKGYDFQESGESILFNDFDSDVKKKKVATAKKVKKSSVDPNKVYTGNSQIDATIDEILETIRDYDSPEENNQKSKHKNSHIGKFEDFFGSTADAISERLDEAINGETFRKNDIFGIAGTVLKAFGGSVKDVVNKVKTVALGELDEESGEYSGGKLPPAVVKAMVKYLPDTLKGATKGAAIGAITKHPILGGAIGAGFGLLKANDDVQKFLWGDPETEDRGLLGGVKDMFKKNIFDPVKNKVKEFLAPIGNTIFDKGMKFARDKFGIKTDFNAVTKKEQIIDFVSKLFGWKENTMKMNFQMHGHSRNNKNNEKQATESQGESNTKGQSSGGPIPGGGPIPNIDSESEDDDSNKNSPFMDKIKDIFGSKFSGFGRTAKNAAISTVLGLGPIPGALFSMIFKKKNKKKSKVSKDDMEQINDLNDVDSDDEENTSKSILDKLGIKNIGRLKGAGAGAVAASILGLNPLLGGAIGLFLTKKKKKPKKTDTNDVKNMEEAENASDDEDRANKSLLDRLGIKGVGRFKGATVGAIAASILGINPLLGGAIGLFLTKKKKKPKKTDTNDKEMEDIENAEESSTDEDKANKSLLDRLGIKGVGRIKGAGVGAIAASILGLNPLLGGAIGLFLSRKPKDKSGGESIKDWFSSTAGKLINGVKGIGSKIGAGAKSLWSTLTGKKSEDKEDKSKHRRAKNTSSDIRQDIDKIQNGGSGEYIDDLESDMNAVDTPEELQDTATRASIISSIMGKSGGDEEKLSGVKYKSWTEMLGDLLGFGGDGGGLLALLAGTKLGKAFIKGAKSIPRLLTGAKNVAGFSTANVLGGLGSIFSAPGEIYKEASTGGDVADATVRTIGKGSFNIGKGVLKSALDLNAGKTSKLATLGPKLAKLITDIGAKLATKFPKAAKLISKFTPKIAKAGVGKIMDFLQKQAPEALATLGAKLGIPVAGWIVLVAGLVVDAVYGWNTAAELLSIPLETKPTVGMCFACAIANAISGLVGGLIPVGWLSRLLYTMCADDKADQELNALQTEHSLNYEKFKQETGSTLTMDQYNKASNKRWFQFWRKDLDDYAEDASEQSASGETFVDNSTTNNVVMTTSDGGGRGYYSGRGVGKEVVDSMKNQSIFENLFGRNTRILSATQTKGSDNAWEKATTKIKSLGSKVWNKISNSALGKMVKGVWGGIKNIGSKIGGAIKNVWGKITGGRGGEDPDYYNQTDPKWSNMSFGKYDGSRDTVGAGGCGPTVMAMALQKLTGMEVTPDEMAKIALNGGYKYDDGGTDPSFFNDVGSSLGLNFDVDDGVSPSTISALSLGKPVIFMGRDVNGKSPFGNNTHYVLGTNIDKNGNVSILDPKNRNNNKSFNIKDIAMSTMQTIGPSLHGGRGNTLKRILSKYVGRGPASWLDCVKACKKSMSNMGIGYSQSTFKDTEALGVTCKGVRYDCSGFVSFCTYVYGVNPNGTMWWTGTMLGPDSDFAKTTGFACYDFTGYNNLEPGDILVNSSHTEIFAYNKGGSHYVYNFGSQSSASNPGETINGNYKYTYVFRPGASSNAPDSTTQSNSSNNPQNNSGYDSAGGVSKGDDAQFVNSNKIVDYFTNIDTAFSKVGPKYFENLDTGFTNAFGGNGTPSSGGTNMPSNAKTSGGETNNSTNGTNPSSKTVDPSNVKLSNPSINFKINESANDNKKKVYALLKQNGISDYGAAAILANLDHENGAYDPRSSTGDNGTAFGLCQWGDRPKEKYPKIPCYRWPNLKKWCTDNGYDYNSVEGQVAYMIKELKDIGIYDKYTSASTFEDGKAAAKLFASDFEVCAEKYRPQRAVTYEKYFSETGGRGNGVLSKIKNKIPKFGINKDFHPSKGRGSSPIVPITSVNSLLSEKQSNNVSNEIHQIGKELADNKYDSTATDNAILKVLNVIADTLSRIEVHNAKMAEQSHNNLVYAPSSGPSIPSFDGTFVSNKNDMIHHIISGK